MSTASKPTAGAMRAAEALNESHDIVRKGGFYAITNESLAQIIDRETGHVELVAACQNAANVLAALATGQLKEISRESAALAQLRDALAKAKGAQS